MKTTQCDFKQYHRLKARLEKDLKLIEDETRYKSLRDLYRRNFPTKEQAIAEVEAFYDKEEIK